MSGEIAVRVDSKGRLTIPREIRDALGMNPGTLLFMRREGEVLSFAKAENPFDALAEAAIAEFRDGRTRSLEDFAREHGLE
jgi:antitoxin PrlF